MNLSQAKFLTMLEIVNLASGEEQKERLQELGILVGTQVQLVRKSPFTGPLIIQVGTAFVALRKDDADAIEVVEAAQV